MTTVLAVPIRLDALRLSTPLPVVEAKVDFTRMPYWDGAREANPDVANISEELVSYPFQDRALVLPPGVHLHWALPDALTRGSSRATAGYRHQLLFPAVPNRWLMTRSGDGTTVRRWIVESDYLHPNNHDFPAGDGKSLRSVAIPFPCDRTNGERPFRYLGRARELSQPEEPGAPEYLSTRGYRLTAVGYQPDPPQVRAPGVRPAALIFLPGGLGEPTFAALYPNCLSVFGFHDPEPPADAKALKYEVVGWFSKPAHDCLATKKLSGAAAADEFKEALKEAYRWEIREAPAKLPESTIFHASIAVGPEPTGPRRETLTVTAAMGNTVTEALSAYLATAKVPGLDKPPSNLEEQLEALHLADQIDHLTIDVGPKFQHARHERGFSAVAGGTVWAVRVPSTPGEPGAQVGALDEDVADLLNRLNVAQRDYDRAADELDSMQKQLFADWYKYMLCAYPPDDARDDYPDIDEVRYFIEKNGLALVEKQKVRREAAAGERDEKKTTLEARLLNTPYALQPQPGPRYHRPREPVLLLAGDGLCQTSRHGQGGTLECAVPAQEVDLADVNSIDALRHGLDGGANPDSAGTWHPFSLDWSVEMKPLLHDGNNLSADDLAYDPDFILKSYRLDSDKVDLTLSGAGAVKPAAASVYTGSSLLTPHATLKLKERIDAFLSRRLLKKFFDARNIPPDQRADDYFAKNVDAIRDWYEANKADKKIGDPVVDTMLPVAAFIGAAGRHVLAQSLNGFNEALLMHRQTFQLPLAEPLGFDDAKEFTRRVADAVGQNTYVAPLPLDDFQPIRTGGFKVLALRLVDTFGRVKEVEVSRWVATEIMPRSAGAGEADLFSLPPRLVQPARLSFRWLAGSPRGDVVEMNSHPATTPLCGWLLPNHLDNSLMVYDAEGRARGAITADAGWQAAPGADGIAQDDLPAHLKGLVAHVTGLKQAGVRAFFHEIENALDKINPASASQHDALALLMGRPIAVARAQVKLELRGLPAVNQSWDAFRGDVARRLRDEDAARAGELVRQSAGVTGVKFPARLGDERQLNDGLLGYWVETAEAGRSVIKADAPFHRGNGSLIELAAAGESLTLTMLLDPRGVVHLTSGILPAAVLEIPHDQYAAAMNAIEVTFLTSPILSPAGRICLPLPDEPGHAWSWVARGKNVQGETVWANPAEIGPVGTQAGWGEPPEIHEGWLRLARPADK